LERGALRVKLTVAVEVFEPVDVAVWVLDSAVVLVPVAVEV
jgi:hypothetical protein